MRDFFECEILPILVIVGIMAALFGVVMGGAVAVMYYECPSFQKATGIPTKIVGLTCYVEVDGRYMPWEQYKTAFETNANLNLRVKP